MTYTTLSEAVAAYSQMIDDMTPDLEVMGHSYSPSWALEELDPIAYKCGWVDWCDSEGIDTDDLEDDYAFSRDRM